MKLPLKYLAVALTLGSIVFSGTAYSQQTNTTQQITIKFAGRVNNQPFACGRNYKLGKAATTVTPLDFRFYVSDVSLIDAQGKVVPLTLAQDGKWQYQNVALIDFENKTGACVNGTVETRTDVIGTVPKGKYKAVRFSLGVPQNLNHEDSTLAPSPLNLTSLWWNWQFGYKFARIDFTYRLPSTGQKQHVHDEMAKSQGFLIHLGSTGCQAETTSQKPTTACSNPNKATITLNNFDPNKNVIVADIAKLLANVDLSYNQPGTAPGCMSEPNDKDCTGVMKNFGIPFGDKTPKQTFFSLK
ncbi:metallo-mystery pair system four-Cys motif protein [Dulcicalothrix desertica PCC 7102]|uniref:Metallo-mystery pair system four-Cys motif protein n=1 Tax=Dulcicalothrix desertica PCC 7102 TaxID=232991 RepID=A0A433V6V9_9CYAN|nr:MbnP family copper-binding protein [Dulcicalothrix desertica]RUT01836.1 metallo-mystery pair system four-Cys motif protein [Dulcicalothrix desertica PCC 7102]TWH42989.1 putative repeat protein (TIGR04052 family) [Dulcicalothrix desertica PCC 7102]